MTRFKNITALPLLSSILLGFQLLFSAANAATFDVHCRNRSPELFPTRISCLGPVAEIVEAALSRNGHKIKWQTVKWDDTIVLAETGEVDMVIRHSMNEEREKFLQKIAYGYEVRQVFYYAKTAKSMQLNKQRDLDGLKIGALEGSFYSQDFADNTRVKKVFFSSAQSIVTALGSGKIDVAVTSSAHDMDTMNILQGIQKANYFEKFYNGRYISIPTNSSRSKYFEEISRTITEMIEKEEITEIFSKYGLEPPFQLID